jgi:hypothetical protein
VLPDAEDSPSAHLQFTIYYEVVMAVIGDLVRPEFTVSFRSAVALRTSVPEAPVNKDNKPMLSEGEVRFARQFQLSPPSRDFFLSEKFNQNTLSLFISLSSDPGHNLGTFGFGDNVDHKYRRF